MYEDSYDSIDENLPIVNLLNHEILINIDAGLGSFHIVHGDYSSLDCSYVHHIFMKLFANLR